MPAMEGVPPSETNLARANAPTNRSEPRNAGDATADPRRSTGDFAADSRRTAGDFAADARRTTGERSVESRNAWDCADDPLHAAADRSTGDFVLDLHDAAAPAERHPKAHETGSAGNARSAEARSAGRRLPDLLPADAVRETAAYTLPTAEVRRLLDFDGPTPERSPFVWGVRAAALLAATAGPALVTAILLGKLSLPAAGLATLLAVGGCWAVLQGSFRRDPIVRAHAELSRLLAAERTAFEASRRAVEQGRDRIRTAHAAYENLRHRLENLREEIRDESIEEQARIRDAGRAQLEELARRRQELFAEQARFVDEWTRAAEAAETHFAERAAALEAESNAQLSYELHLHREAVLAERLKAVPIAGAAIAGIGPKLSAKLAESGIVTAAEALPDRLAAVAGFGPKKAQVLLAWREKLETSLRRELPLVLPDATLSAAQAAREGKLAELSDRQAEHAAERLRLREAAEARAAERFAQLDQAVRSVRERTRDGIEEIRRASEDWFRDRGPLLVEQASRRRCEYDAAIADTLAADSAASSTLARIERCRLRLARTPRFGQLEYALFCLTGRCPDGSPRVAALRRPLGVVPRPHSSAG